MEEGQQQAAPDEVLLHLLLLGERGVRRKVAAAVQLAVVLTGVVRVVVCRQRVGVVGAVAGEVPRAGCCGQTRTSQVTDWSRKAG